MTGRSHGEHVYRGTTLGWPGNETNRRLGLTSLSVDPVVATLFAIRCRNAGGPAVLHLVEAAGLRLSENEENWFGDLEGEVVASVTASELEVRAARTISVEDAANALRAFGIEVPVRIPPSDNALNDILREHRRLTPSELPIFDRLVGVQRDT